MAAPAPATEYECARGPSQPMRSLIPPPRGRADLIISPPLIAMVAVVGTAFLVVFYVRLLSRHLRRCRRRWRQWRRRRRLALSTDLESNGGGGGGGVGFDYYSSGASSNYFLSPYGLDDLAIKTLPLSFYSAKAAKQFFYRECAVCLVEFEENDSLRTLPLCAHAFHVDCIDVWLRSHANCPLCRASVFRQESSPFVPMRAARIRPSFDDLILDPPLPPPPPPPPPEPDYSISEIIPEVVASPGLTQDDDPNGGGGPRDFLLKRSYSFGFERNLVAERMMLDASTVSPWRYRQNRGFWSKRWPSPFGGGGGGSSSSRATRVFSFRSYRGTAVVKSPFFQRRSFFPLSESSIRFGGAGPSSRRTRSLTSPVTLFPRLSSATSGSASSRLRCGDPEALLSPERLLNPGNRR
ncbi:hypothetical protein Taro_002276 [Colocasia esculenta]|uniref:RING-type E3 ubiquitin transferase n=1 Tax=Colocasia esculenta TaxID=4460 RepID=A0A843TCB3_COLES|nr:hypothetical protein [Colocasia esculenta]